MTAEPIRLAVFHLDFERDGPGLLLRDIERGEDPEIDAAAHIIAELAPDVLLLLGFDYDAENRALTAFSNRVAEAGLRYPHLLALRPNTGRATGHDLDNDGRLGEPEDSHGYGRFSGQGGMALVSRLPFGSGIVDHSAALWYDVSGAGPSAFFHVDAARELRLFGVAAWQVPLQTASGPLTIFAVHASAPVFDGPEDRNGHRNADQMRYVMEQLDEISGPVALLGTLNVDPERGEGHRDVVRLLLSHAALQDAQPRRPGMGLETVDWPEPRPGDLRVDYVLPPATSQVIGSGVHWPEEDSRAALASAHRLVFVDIQP